MATKVFSVEQLRLNNELLSGDSLNRLWYAGNQLAAGSTAVPTGYDIFARHGLVGGGFMDGSQMILDVNVQTNGGLEVDNDALRVKPGSLDNDHVAMTAGIDIAKLQHSGITIDAQDGLVANNAGLVHLGETLELDIDIATTNPGLGFVNEGGINKLKAVDIDNDNIAMTAGIDIAKLQHSGIHITNGYGLEGFGASETFLGETYTVKVKGATAGSYANTIDVHATNGVGVKKVPNALTHGLGIASLNYDGGTAAVTVAVDTDQIVMMTGDQSIAGVKDFTGEVHVHGNLTVDGTQTIVDSTIVNIGDNQIVLNSDATNSATNEDGGILIKRFDSSNNSENASLLWDHSETEWRVGLEGAEKPVARGKAYVADCAAGITTKTIDITTLSAGAAPHAVAILKNTTDSNADIIGCMVTAVTATAVTVDFTAPLPSANYDLEIMCMV